MHANQLTGKSFYLDAGHGGHDSGAINISLNLKEKVATLDITKRLGELLETAGAKVFYSRKNNDHYPALVERASQANNAKVDAFISIHLNSADNKDASGIETFVYSLQSTSKANILAKYVQDNLIKATGAKDRGVKEFPQLVVLRNTTMPAILCEVGFISNSGEAVKLFNSAYQTTIAEAIYKAVLQTYSNLKNA